MIAAEFGSTGALAIFWFHKLFAEKVMKPFRLPCTPGVNPLHALGGGVFPVTCTLTDPDEVLPGFGLVTLTENVPGVFAFPVAVSFDALTKVVVSAEPAKVTCAPDTKSLPFTVMAKAPVGKLAGTTLASPGVGFKSVTALVPFALESAALIALTVAEFGSGRLAGGV